MNEQDLKRILNELSKGTLGRYIKKAADQQGTYYSYWQKYGSGKDLDKSIKRTKGLHKAVDKLTKEDTSRSGRDSLLESIMEVRNKKNEE